MTRAAATLILAASLPLLARDAITLRDGTRHYGTFVSGTGQTVTFNDESTGRRQYNLSQVQTVEFDVDSSSRAQAGDRRSSRYATPDGKMLPAGTELTVRANEQIQSDTATTGRAYSGSVEKDIVDSNGEVIIPRGSEAQLVIRRMSNAGAVGSSDLSLDLDSVTVGGRVYQVSTEDVRRSGREGIGANRRTAEMVGGGAALGTLLGAIAGGGKGAAIGAIAGAAVGGGAQVLTRGRSVNVPAETVLTFRLDQPVYFNGRG